MRFWRRIPREALAVRATRVALRRWRLWWRYQLRVLKWRIVDRPLQRFGAPPDDLPRSRLVLRAGRLTGRTYLFIAKTKERARIERARIPDRVEPARTSFALINLQRSLFFGLAVLILVGLALDQLLRADWGPAERLGVGDWLRSHLSKPSDETLRNLLAAAAAGTATILGLVLSISLIVWQATADRYRSSTIIGFLLRERLSAAVVRLLALGFAYSLWVLALLEVFGFRLYASAALALVLSTAAVLSLISYRQLGLLGYLPGSIARSLRQEIGREVLRGQRESAGRSVENYSRQVVESDLQIFRDLVIHLRIENQLLDIRACLEELAAVLAMYIRAKPRFRYDSLFFVLRRERLGPSGYAIEEAIGAEGLMAPTTGVPDHLWFERSLLDVVDDVATPTLLADPGVATSLVQLWATALQHAWYAEDPDAVDILLERIETAAVHPELRATPDSAETLLSVPWVLVEMAGTGFMLHASDIVERAPWRDGKRLIGLPWMAQADGRKLARQVRTELMITGDVATPRAELIREVEKRRQPRLHDLQSRLVPRAVAFVRSQLASAAGEDSREAIVIAQMAIRTLLRIAHHRLELPDLTGLAREIVTTTTHADHQQVLDLRDETGRAARVLAQGQEWPAAYELLRAAELLGLLGRSQVSDDGEQLRLFYDGLFIAAIVYGWGEFHSRTDHVREVGQYLEQPYADLSLLAEAAAEHRLTGLMFPTVVHYQWAQALSIAASELEDHPVFHGGIGYDLEKAHPSDLFSRSGVLGVGPLDCLEHLIAAAVGDRTAARQDLLNVIAALVAKRSKP